jgi:hypothetical protein
MNWNPTDEEVRELAHVLRIEMGSFLAHAPAHPDRFWTIPTRAMLAAVGPMIAARALRDAAGDARHRWGVKPDPSDWLTDRADTIEKGAGR